MRLWLWLAFLNTAASALAAEAPLIELLNEAGESRAVEVQRDRHPLGLYIATREGLPIGVCNAFRLDFGAKPWVLTARHCLEKAKEDGASHHFLYHFHNRTGKLQAFDWRDFPEALELSHGGKAFSSQLIALPIDPERAKFWDALPFEKSTPEGETFLVWSYRALGDATRYGKKTFQMRTVKCRGKFAVSPAFEAVWRLGEDSFRKSYRISYSKSGLANDERFGLFLEGCPFRPGESGSLITDEQGKPVALFHTGMDSSSMNATWKEEIYPRFLKEFFQEKGDRETNFNQFALEFASLFEKPKKIDWSRESFFYGVGLPLYWVAEPEGRNFWEALR